MRREELERMTRAYQESRTLLTAIELNVFTAIGSGSDSTQVSARISTLERPTKLLLNALVALGLLEKQGEMFLNTPVAAELLDDGSADCIRGSLLHTANRWHNWLNLTAHVRGTMDPEDQRLLDPSRHEDWLANLDRRSSERAPYLIAAIGASTVSRILDVGGGSAVYSIEFARHNPNLIAEVIDLPEMIPITEGYIARAGMGSRLVARPCNLLVDPLGHGYDLILLCSLVHLFGAAQIQSLLGRCHEALNPGGRVVILDHVLNADKTAPRAGAIFALNMLLTTASGGTYSYDEYSSWLTAAGFSQLQRHPLPGPQELLIAKRY